MKHASENKSGPSSGIKEKDKAYEQVDEQSSLMNDPKVNLIFCQKQSEKRKANSMFIPSKV